MWVLSPSAVGSVVGAIDDVNALRRSGVLWFRSPDADGTRRVVGRWLDFHDRITSGDYAALTGTSYAGARGALDRMVSDDLLERGAAAGRNAHYVPAAR